MVSSPTPIRFDVYRGQQLLRSETIAELIIKLGTDARSHLRLDDEAASRLHAMIEVSSLGEIHIVDLGSRTGTFVNGEKSQRASLHAGDEVRIGETRIVVGLDAVSEQPADARSLPFEAHAEVSAPPLATAAGALSSARGIAPSASRHRWAPLLIILALLVVLLAALALYRKSSSGDEDHARVGDEISRSGLLLMQQNAARWHRVSYAFSDQ